MKWFIRLKPQSTFGKFWGLLEADDHGVLGPRLRRN